MKIIATIARIILGCVFVFFGLNIFWQFLHMPPLPNGPAGDFAKALFVSHYIYVVGVLEVVGGVLWLLIQWAKGPYQVFNIERFFERSIFRLVCSVLKISLSTSHKHFIKL